MKTVNINGVKIGLDYPCYTIAEAGANHDGDINKAFKLIDAAVEAKADSVKFQTYKANKLTIKKSPKYWNDGKENETQYDVFKKLDSLTNDHWKQIFEYAKKKEITCFSTPFDEKSVDLLYDLNVPAYKIASADITHIPLIKHISSKHLPIFISTGMASNEEIQEAVNTIEDTGNHDVIILHCMTSYPTKYEDANISMIKTLSEQFPEYIIGYSDHTPGITSAICSIVYGCKVIEKHFTFDHNLTISPDHRLSLDAKQFCDLVKNIRIAEQSIGKPKRNDFDCEKQSIKFARRSIVSTSRISKGTIITKDMIDFKRPATGIYPKFFDKVIGKIALNEIKEDTPIQWSDIEN